MCAANHCSEIHLPVLPFSVEILRKHAEAKLWGGFYFLCSLLSTKPYTGEQAFGTEVITV